MSQSVMDPPAACESREEPPAPAAVSRSGGDLSLSWALVVFLFGGLILFFALMTGMLLLVERANPSSSALPEGGATTSASSPVQTLDVTLTEFAITPSTVDVLAGVPVTFHVINRGSLPHNLVLDAGHTTPDIAAGGTADLRAGPFTKPFQAFCSIPGHKQAGMLMTVNVTGAATPAGATPSGGTVPDAKINFSATPGPAWHAFDPALAPASGATVHDVTFIMKELVSEVAPGVTQQVWTFNSQVPGPVLRGHIGDVFNVTVVNGGFMTHSIDFHASEVAPNVAMAPIGPGKSLVYQFKAGYSGIWMYHCGTAPALEHIANGMSGAVIIDPLNLAPVAHEYVMIQSELYLGPQGEPGDYAKMLIGDYDAVVFNGYVNQYKYAPIKVDPGQRIRIWALDAGPSDISSFHIVGTIFDTVFKEGRYDLQPGNPTGGGSQALDLMPAEGGFVETTFAQPGVYTMVSHKFDDATRGDLGTFDVGGASGAVKH